MERWKGEKFNSLPAEKQEEVIERVSLGAAVAKKKFELAKARRKELKDGREYLAERGLPIVEMQLGDYRIMGVVEWNKDVSGRVAYAVCSPRDMFSKKLGRGLVGSRLKREPIRFTIPCGEYQTVRGAKAEIMRALLNSCRVPPRIFKDFG